jgi:hypothetical protein
LYSFSSSPHFLVLVFFARSSLHHRVVVVVDACACVCVCVCTHMSCLIIISTTIAFCFTKKKENLCSSSCRRRLFFEHSPSQIFLTLLFVFVFVVKQRSCALFALLLLLVLLFTGFSDDYVHFHTFVFVLHSCADRLTDSICIAHTHTRTASFFSLLLRVSFSHTRSYLCVYVYMICLLRRFDAIVVVCCCFLLLLIWTLLLLYALSFFFIINNNNNNISHTHTHAHTYIHSHLTLLNPSLLFFSLSCPLLLLHNICSLSFFFFLVIRFV